MSASLIEVTCGECQSTKDIPRLECDGAGCGSSFQMGGECDPPHYAFDWVRSHAEANGWCSVDVGSKLRDYCPPCSLRGQPGDIG